MGRDKAETNGLNWRYGKQSLNPLNTELFGHLALGVVLFLVVSLISLVVDSFCL